MSLNQLTANYTDSEGEEDDQRNSSLSPDKHQQPGADKDASPKDTPGSHESKSSATNSPKRKVGRLVSYANDDEEDQTFYKDDDDDDSDEILNSEPMDTGTEDGEEDRTNDVRDFGIKLPSPPSGKCSTHLQEKVAHFLNRVKEVNTDWNKKIQNNKAFRNPSIYEKLIDHLGLDEMGSNYPLEMFDPHCWGKESYYDELSRVQKEEMDKREKERKEKTKIDIISGTKKPPEEEAKKRKSRFDQAAVPGSAVAPIKNSVPPPTLTTVPSGNKTTISAFGSLKKSK